MSPELDARINAMLGRDRAWAIFFVIVLWLVVGVVFFGIASLVTIPTVKTALVIAGLLVLIFNTASIIAMVKHYDSDKQFIYGTDIRHLDAKR
jgi:hypothetical protein